MSSSKSSSSTLHGIGSLPSAPIEHDTQQLFEAYWQRGKFDGKPLVLDASIYAQTPRAPDTRFDGNYGGFEDAPDPVGTGQQRDASAPPSKDRSASASTSNPASSGNEAGSVEPPQGLTKAQARRAQVRRAQIQHRQRKADYTKHLEMESAKYRDLVDQTQRETYALETENEEMRQMLIAKLGYLPPQALPLSSAAIEAQQSEVVAGESGDVMAWEPSAAQAEQSSPSASGRSHSAVSIPMPVYSVSVTMSDVMGTPAMQVRRTSSPKQISPRSGGASESQTPPSPTTPVAIGAGQQQHDVSEAIFKPADIITSLSEEQTDHAINFILGLEHICWDHWDRSYFTHETYDETGCMHGHALMASTIALQAAPVEVFSQLDAVGEYLRSNPLQQGDRSEHGRCDHEGAPGAHRQHDPRSTQQASSQRLSTSSAPAGQSEAAVTGSASRGSISQAGVVGDMARQGADSSQTVQPGIPMLQDGNNISWPATGLSLETLHALASKLSPPETELAPVQAWFEILRNYGVSVVLDQPLMARVLAEFSGVVKCLHFGAVIERDAFDSVVSRVITGAQ